MYSLLRPAYKPNRVKVTKDTYREVKSTQAYIHPDGHLLG
jgi:hypothetical protein